LGSEGKNRGFFFGGGGGGGGALFFFVGFVFCLSFFFHWVGAVVV